MLNKKTKIAVIFGGPSGEHQVSCVSAGNIVNALIDGGYENVFPIGVSTKGKWYGPIKAEDIETFNPETYADKELIFPQHPGVSVHSAKNFAPVFDIDVVFPIIHGSYGEDGHLQALLEMCRIPFVGAGMGGSFVGMDKVFMRDILRAHNIPQTDYMAIRRYDFEHDTERTLDQIEAALEYPMFVKPSCSGSSVGISKATNREQLREALVLAGKYDGKLLVEKGVNAREIETALLGNYDVSMACPGEVVTEGVFYDYDSKYILNNSVTKVPAELSDETIAELERIGRETYRILDLQGFCRADFFINKDNGEILVNEVNTLPGFTAISMYAKMWAASGKPLLEVIENLLTLAFERNKDILRNYTAFGG